MVHYDPKTMQPLEEGPPCPFLPALLSETIKHRQQSDYFQPTGGDVAFSWTLPVHGLRQKVLYLLTDWEGGVHLTQPSGPRLVPAYVRLLEGWWGGGCAKAGGSWQG